MTPTNVPVSELGRQLVPAGELKPDAWLAPGEDPAAKVLAVHPYVDAEGTPTVHVTYLPVGDLGPISTDFYAAQEIELATPAEIKQAEGYAERLAVATHLRAFADLILHKELPMEQLHITHHAGGVDRLAEVAAALDLEVRAGTDRYRSVNWPKGHQTYDSGLHVTWYAYAEKETEPSVVDRDEVVDADGSVPVPADVEGVAVGAGAVRQVSAPPAGGAQ